MSNASSTDSVGPELILEHRRMHNVIIQPVMLVIDTRPVVKGEVL